MKLTISSLTAVLFAVSVTAIAPPKPGKIPIIDAEDASAIFPYGLKLGSKVEGASVDAYGVIYATDGSNIINLKDGTIALQGPGSAEVNATSWLSSSRFCPRSGNLLAGDAVGHKVFYVQSGQKQTETFFHSEKFLQPNDMAISSCGRFLYFSGMNYTADSEAGVHGELAWLDLYAPPIEYGSNLQKVSKEVLAQGHIYRSNGIEVIDQGGKKYLYLTSAQNKNFTVVSTLVTRFELDTTGEPKNPMVVLDIAKYIEERTQGQITQQDIIKAGMDPDGMRSDIDGNLYLTLNAYQKVLRWNPKTGDGILVNLKTVAFPTNLELGGSKGDEVYVIGRCVEKTTESCIDVIRFQDRCPGRAFTSLQKHPKDRLRRRV